MGYTLKLDIYYFSIKKITQQPKRRLREGEESRGYKTEDEDSIFHDFLHSIPASEEAGDEMSVFLEDFINGFTASFKPNKKNTQAISITTDQYKGYDSSKSVIWGLYKGGSTGIGLDVYTPGNATTPTNRIDKNNVASLSYFYKIWIPFDSNVGVLMVQSYTTTGCAGLFREQLGNYFISKGYKVEWSKCIPQAYIEKYLKDGSIHAIQVIHRDRDEKQPLDPLFNPFVKAKRRTLFSNFRIPFADLVSVRDYKSVLKSQIKSIDLSYDEDRDSIKLFYTDSSGRRAHSTLSEIDHILPTITLDDALKDEETQLPKWDDLHRFTKELLEHIQREISYTPQLR